jgi:hypothetical protein
MRKLHEQILARSDMRSMGLPPIDVQKIRSEGPILVLIFDGEGTRGTLAAQVPIFGKAEDCVASLVSTLWKMQRDLVSKPS